MISRSPISILTAMLATGLAVGACTLYGPPLPVYTAPPPAYAYPPPARPAPYAPPPAAATPLPMSGATSETVVDERGRSLSVEHGPPGDPAVVGCADGRREAFIDSARYPNIAGCLGSWPGRQTLRARVTGRACGDELGPCATPADLCAPGWHVCGSNGAVAELRQVSAEECEHAGGGRFAAGISHCKVQQGCAADPTPDASYACFPSGWCSEPVCCGRDCGDFGACRDGVWPQHTHIPFGQDQGCGSTESRRAGGVLCCR
jgi:hypothetical protein